MAVIDEIQLLRDPGRGWAWTRAFLGIIADEIHVCGELGAATLLQRLCDTTGETVEVTKPIRTVGRNCFLLNSFPFQIREYKRLTKLTVEDTALGTLDNVVPGDCIVCFSKNDIYAVSRQIEARCV